MPGPNLPFSEEDVSPRAVTTLTLTQFAVYWSCPWICIRYYQHCFKCVWTCNCVKALCSIYLLLSAEVCDLGFTSQDIIYLPKNAINSHVSVIIGIMYTLWCHNEPHSAIISQEKNSQSDFVITRRPTFMWRTQSTEELLVLSCAYYHPTQQWAHFYFLYQGKKSCQ